jgi:hypothetical protein
MNGVWARHLFSLDSCSPANLPKAEGSKFGTTKLIHDTHMMPSTMQMIKKTSTSSSLFSWEFYNCIIIVETPFHALKT